MSKRLGAIAGLAFLLLNWGSLGLMPEPPSPTAAAAEWLAWAHDHHDGILAYAFIGGISTLVLIGWYATTRDRVWGDAPRTGLAGSATVGLSGFVGGFIVGLALLSSAAFRAAAGSPEIVAFAGTAGHCVIVGSQFGIATFVAAVCIQAARSASLPTWLVALGGLTSVAAAVSGLSLAVASSAVLAAATMLSWLGLSVWMVAVSLLLWRSDAAERLPSAAPATAVG